MPSLSLSVQRIAARVHGTTGLAASAGPEGFPCVRYIGPGGSGHYVKMVHNGIEYGDMQLIAEAAYLCKEIGGLTAPEIANLFDRLNEGPLSCFLMETTAAVYLKEDDTQASSAPPLSHYSSTTTLNGTSNGAPPTPAASAPAATSASPLLRAADAGMSVAADALSLLRAEASKTMAGIQKVATPEKMRLPPATTEGKASSHALVDYLLDSCGSKGTGKWTIQQAAELGVPCSTHAAALEARYLSSLKAQRGALAARFPAASGKKPVLPVGWQEDLEDALLASKLCSYAQGMAHLRAVSDVNKWDLQLSELCAIWQGGCIIRAKILNLVEAALTKDPSLPNLLMDDAIAAEMARREPGWRRFVLLAMTHGVPVPALSASLTYFDTLRSSLLHSDQCIQAQRDCFGGHGYQRLDKAGTFSSKWRK